MFGQIWKKLLLQAAQAVEELNPPPCNDEVAQKAKRMIKVLTVAFAICSIMVGGIYHGAVRTNLLYHGAVRTNLLYHGAVRTNLLYHGVVAYDGLGLFCPGVLVWLRSVALSPPPPPPLIVLTIQYLFSGIGGYLRWGTRIDTGNILNVYADYEVGG